MVVLQHGLKLSIRYAGAGASQEVQAKVSLNLCSYWDQLAELQSNLQLAAICAEFECAEVSPSYEPRLAAVSAELGPHSNRHRAC